MFSRNRQMIDAIEREQQQARRTVPPGLISPIEEAMNNYRHMEAELEEVRRQNSALVISNNSLVAEANMLREQYEKADNDRVRLQAVCGLLTGELAAVKAVIDDVVQRAAKHGIVTADEHERQREQPPAEGAEPEPQPAEFLSRVTPLQGNSMS